ncbi:MAG: hypothetical protein JWO20_577 [Candidatus Angelobacter sp.]|jgi:hypothetical protein|nr:hypothetical protein [Candidatus Angelobacter sp.]
MEEPRLLPDEPKAEEPRGPWLGLAIGFLIIIAIIGALIYSSRKSETRQSAQPDVMESAAAADPYASQLKISDGSMSAAENMLGGEVTYIEGNITNTGDKTVAGATVEVTFKNSLGQVVQRQTEPLWIVQRREPAVDVAVAPIKPGETREFRLSFEHISTDWNRQFPDLRITVVTTK